MPALLISGDRSPERLRQAAAAGMTRVLYKPVAPAALKSAIAAAVGLID
jgi:CheY-like chemotaxis protein